MSYRATAFAFLIGISSILQAQAPIQAPASKVAGGIGSGTTGSINTAVDTPYNYKEDWTELLLAKSGLQANAADSLAINRLELEDCTRELVRLEWRPNDPIELYVITPKGVSKPPVTLFLLNYTFDTDIFRDPAWCREAKLNGVATVGFGSALSRQRFHSPRPMKQWFVSELQESLATSTHDVQMVLNYLDRRGDLDMKHVGILGQGSGGAIAILAAAVDPRITALDLLDPWGDWPDWLKGSKQVPEEERAAYLKPEFLSKVANLDPVTFLPRLNLKSLRIQQTASDLITPPAARDKLSASAPGSTSVLRYPDIVAERTAWGGSGISGWIVEQLRSGDSRAANSPTR